MPTLHTRRLRGFCLRFTSHPSKPDNPKRAVLDSSTGLLRFTTAQFANLKSLFFTIGGTTFELTANAQA
ncbi:hypothetical protein M422DRAFT_264729 [Sphaerobolus stellatus SS14]|uniref:Unplaced genomic scaffold SPHSTscaffold_139, whole genome shotgun sequence n=1 Tax=Sphaerobolus stellatus (strain SS14) TaxID=990650 RepID=A0A0C9UVN4_SPHS4|nr:hypothetical protein M422DRAFT_264729 [Sphaerobolus stellatus SS14]